MLAAEERRMISARTKAALAAAKARAAGRDAQQERARSRATNLIATIQELRAAGSESLRAIAAGLEERGIPTARGGKWSAVQVSRAGGGSRPFRGKRRRRRVKK